MPSWSIRYQGALDDQQINDLVNYLVYHELRERPVRGQRLPEPRRGQGGQLAVSLAVGTSGSPRHGRGRRAPDATGSTPDARAGSHAASGSHIDCGTLFKGAGVTIMAFILFVGSVYLMLSVVFGRWMGYLVLAVSLLGLADRSSRRCGSSASGRRASRRRRTSGPRGPEPAWVVLEAGPHPTSEPLRDVRRRIRATVGGPTERRPTPSRPVREQRRHVVPGRAGERGAGPRPRATRRHHRARSSRSTRRRSPRPRTARRRWRWCRRTSPAAGRSDVSLYHDSGSVPALLLDVPGGVDHRCSLIHLPLLDRAEKKRKEFLTGGSAPAWYGPA